MTYHHVVDTIDQFHRSVRLCFCTVVVYPAWAFSESRLDLLVYCNDVDSLRQQGFCACSMRIYGCRVVSCLCMMTRNVLLALGTRVCTEYTELVIRPVKSQVSSTGHTPQSRCLVPFQAFSVRHIARSLGLRLRGENRIRR